MLKKLNTIAVALFALSPLVLATIDARAEETAGAEGKQYPAAQAPAVPPVVSVDTVTEKKAPAAEEKKAPEQAPAPAPAPQPQAVNITPVPLAETKAQPIVEVVPPRSGKTALGRYESIAQSDISKYVRGFKARIVDNHLKLTGLVNRECLKHLRIELDDPTIVREQDVDTNATSDDVWALRVERANVVDKENPKAKPIASADDVCKENSAEYCTQDECADISQVIGVSGIHDTELNKDGKIVYRTNDYTMPKDHSDFVKLNDIADKLGGSKTFAEYQSKETKARLAREKRQQEKDEKIVSTCKDAAEKGDRDKYEELKELLGTKGVEKYKELLAQLDNKVFEKEVKELEDKISKQKSIAELNDLIDEIDNFGREKEHKDARKNAVKLLLLVANAGNDLDDLSDSGFQAKLKLVERALKVARGLDPKNEELRKALFIAKRERFKASADSGNDRFYNDTTRREAYNTFREVARWASRSKDAEAKGIFREYAKMMSPRMVPVSQQNPYTGQTQVMGYVPGNSLDEQFVRSNQQQQISALGSYDDQFQAYKQGLMFDGVGGNYNYGGQNSASF